MIVVVCILVLTRKGKELKAPRHASAAATRDNTCLIPNTSNSFFMVAIYIQITQSSCNGASTRYVAVFCHILLAIIFCQILLAILAPWRPSPYLLLPLNLTFNSYMQSICVNKCLQCLVWVCLRYHIYQVILAINPLNLKEFLTLVGLLKCHNINYKALLLYGTKLN